MLPREENELLTRIGPETAMGRTMRLYWIPACLASEVAEPDGPPVRVRLLGENLVAFRDSVPAPPKFAWTQAPETHRHVTKVVQECNWLQALEGGLDTSHAPIMHRLLKDDARRGGVKPSNPYVRAGAPTLVVDVTDYGYQYVGIRPLGADEMHVRTYHFILPFHQIRYSTSERGLPTDAGHCWVPIDDETCMVYNWCYSKS